ncbi:Actin-related protein 8 [Vitis vinifera]|uniref:Actin-related protein 8 n=1 Tax=Vitis vinifera TaxID=29760 RepID=A0A438G4P3_VITVI|nr:Actin-related protein 8 [Vitis vinifera]
MILIISLYRMHVKPSAQPIVLSVPICHYDDNESAKASRRQLKETIHSVLFDMNVLLFVPSTREGKERKEPKHNLN